MLTFINTNIVHCALCRDTVFLFFCCCCFVVVVFLGGGVCLLFLLLLLVGCFVDVWVFYCFVWGGGGGALVLVLF